MCFRIYFIFPHNFSAKRVCDETKIGELVCELLGNLILSLPSPYFKKNQHLLQLQEYSTYRKLK